MRDKTSSRRLASAFGRRSRAATRASAVLLLASLAAATDGCSEYGLPPTDCDDWCHAVQRAACDEDDPVDCVQACEDQRATRDARACGEKFGRLSGCLSSAPAADFGCEDGVTQPTSACLDERRDFAACMAPAGGPCFELCERKAAQCGESLPACESSCYELDPACEPAASAYYACAEDVALVCGGGATDSSEDPCVPQALEFLKCVGY